MSFFFKRAPHVKFVGFSTEDTTATPTLSAKAGDLILAWAVESGTTNLPTIPAGLGWVAVQAGVAGNASGTLVAYRKVVTDGEGHGTWGGTLRGVYYQAFRNVDWHDPIGAHAQGNNASNANITNSALTLETRNCMVATGALVSSGTGPGIRSDCTLSKERLSSSPRVRVARSTTRRVRSWASEVVGNTSGTSAAGAHAATEIRGRRR